MWNFRYNPNVGDEIYISNTTASTGSKLTGDILYTLDLEAQCFLEMKQNISLTKTVPFHFHYIVHPDFTAEKMLYACICKKISH